MADLKKLQNCIGGELRAPANGEYIDCVDPSTGQVYAQVPDSGPEDLEAAVGAAKGAFKDWKNTPIQERGACLERLADLIDARIEDFIQAECVDNGKTISACRNIDIPRGIANLRFYAAAAQHFSSECHSMGHSGFNYTLREPLGVVSTISPWNFPFHLFTWKLGPALVAGNCLIAKPSELTPMTAYLTSELITEAGFPPGVFSVLHGRGAGIGAAISSHPDIAAVSFTGGTVTGAEIARVASPQFKKVSLELGGKNPFIVFEDAKWEAALECAKRAAYANQGQICLCGSRLFVQRSVYDRFKEDFVKVIEGIRIGDPLEESTEHGANISEAHMQKILDYIELAKKDGGQVLAGGKRRVLEGRCQGGYFIEPTLIDGLDASCRINREEVFGPVATLIPFDSEEEVLAMANSVDFGLAASIWTQDINRGHRMAREIENGVVWVNTWNTRDLRTPFGGVKASGTGREGGWESLRFFTEPKNVCIYLEN